MRTFTRTAKLAVAVLMVAGVVAPAAAADASAPPSDASLEQLMAASKTESVLKQTIGTIEQSMRQSATAAVEGRPISIEQQQAIDTSLHKTADILREELGWEKMKPIYLQVYKELYTQREVDGLIAFYRTPVGKSFVEKTPLLAQKTAALMQQRMAVIMPRLQAALQEAAQEAAKQPQ